MKAIKMMALFASMALFMPAFTSCNNDDDDEPESVDISKITGSYSGVLGWKVQTYEGEFDDAYQLQILPEKNDDDDVTVVLPACTFKMPGVENPQTIPSLTISDVDVDMSGSNVHRLSKDNFNVELDGVVYTGSLHGTVIGHTAGITYSLTPGRMPMVINFTYSGTLEVN